MMDALYIRVKKVKVGKDDYWRAVVVLNNFPIVTGEAKATIEDPSHGTAVTIALHRLDQLLGKDIRVE